MLWASHRLAPTKPAIWITSIWRGEKGGCCFLGAIAKIVQPNYFEDGPDVDRLTEDKRVHFSGLGKTAVAGTGYLFLEPISLKEQLKEPI